MRTSLLADAAWSHHRSPVAEAPWLFNPGTKTFVTYDDPDSLAAKSAFARECGLRGVFTWSLDADDPRHGLFDAMAGPFTPASRG